MNVYKEQKRSSHVHSVVPRQPPQDVRQSAWGNLVNRQCSVVAKATINEMRWGQIFPRIKTCRVGQQFVKSICYRVQASVVVGLFSTCSAPSSLSHNISRCQLANPGLLKIFFGKPQTETSGKLGYRRLTGWEAAAAIHKRRVSWSLLPLRNRAAAAPPLVDDDLLIILGITCSFSNSTSSPSPVSQSLKARGTLIS